MDSDPCMYEAANQPIDPGFILAGDCWFGYLILNLILAIKFAYGDELAAIATTYILLLLLFFSLAQLDRETANSPKHTCYKVQVLVEIMLLSLVFSYGAAVIPVLISVLVWGMAGVTITTCFYLFFIYNDKKSGPVGQKIRFARLVLVLFCSSMVSVI